MYTTAENSSGNVHQNDFFREMYVDHAHNILYLKSVLKHSNNLANVEKRIVVEINTDNDFC